MTITIGRAVLSDPAQRPQQQGDMLQFQVPITTATTGGSVAAAKIVRQQLLGLVDNVDEPVVPVTSSDDPTWDGYYVPVGVDVEPFPVFLSSGAMLATIALRRVAGGYANPAIETYVVNRVVTNEHGIVPGVSFALGGAYPTSSVGVELDLSGLPEMADVEIASADGSVSALYDTSFDDFEGWSRAYTPPAVYYDAPACYIADASTGLPVVGRQVSALTADNWEMRNGLVGVGAIGGDNEVEIYAWDGTSTPGWRAQTIQAGSFSGADFVASGTHEINGAGPPIILRNSPETCSIRVTNGLNEPTFTFTIWRGGTIVVVIVDTPAAASPALGISPTAAGSSITAGIRTSATDGNGNRFVFLNRRAVTRDTTRTALRATDAATRSVFAACWNIDAATDLGPFGISSSGLLDQLCAPPQFQQRVSER